MNRPSPTAGAAYLPGRAAEGRAGLGPDEDEFTLAVAAGELLELDPRAAPIARIDLFGGFRPEHVETIAVALGATAAEVAVHPDEAAAMTAFLGGSGSGAAAGTARRLVIAASGSSGENHSPGAVALLFDAAPGGARVGPPPPRESERVAHLGGEASGLRVAAGVLGDAQILVVGAPLGRADSLPAPKFDEGALAGELSEGAYVPQPRYRENLPSRWRFAADRCGRCGAITFPPRGRCRKCGAFDGLTVVELPRTGGVIEAMTTVHAGAQPTEFDWRMPDKGAYDVALVRIHPEVRVTLQVAESAPASLHSGDRVDTVLRRLYPFEGAWRYGRKAVPAGFTNRTSAG